MFARVLRSSAKLTRHHTQHVRGVRQFSSNSVSRKSGSSSSSDALYGSDALYICDHYCGFTSDVDTVNAHESSCLLNPDSKVPPKTAQSRHLYRTGNRIALQQNQCLIKQNLFSIKQNTGIQKNQKILVQNQKILAENQKIYYTYLLRQNYILVASIVGSSVAVIILG